MSEKSFSLHLRLRLSFVGFTTLNFASLISFSYHVYVDLLNRPTLTNDDFRKLLMTPKVAAPNVAPPSANTSKIKS